MAWRLEGVTMEACVCKTLCLCNLGPADLPNGHSGLCLWEIRRGESEGVDLSGTTTAMIYEMPGDFTTPGGTSRVYIGDSASPEQYRELEAIFTGQRGGVFEYFGDSLLPVRSATISMRDGDQPRGKVGDVAEMVLRRRKTQSGKQTMLVDAEWLGPMGVTSDELCDSSGSRWADPDMHRWNAGGAGGVAAYVLSA